MYIYINIDISKLNVHDVQRISCLYGYILLYPLSIRKPGMDVASNTTQIPQNGFDPGQQKRASDIWTLQSRYF